MNLIEKLKLDLEKFLEKEFGLPTPYIFSFELKLEKDRKFGDISTNVAMLLAKDLKKAPKEIAEFITKNFKNGYIENLEIAGPGFINIFLKPEAFENLLEELISQKEEFFKNNNNHKFNYNIEFLSANPTGPLHLGNGRGGIIGDVLANILKFLKNQVTKEYYINDAGSQIGKLGLSLKARCLQQLGQNIELPEEGYHGEYLVTIAQELVKKEGSALLEKDNNFFSEYAKNEILKEIKQTLTDYGIEYDIWFSEKELHNSGAIKKAINYLTNCGYTFTQDDALWFKSTQFNDDKDRVLIRANGEPTYTAADIAYMQNKIDRGANYMIMTLGHDHHSFALRLQGLHTALGLEKYPLEIILYQLVKMKIKDEQVRMSKRAGNVVTLEDVVKTVGKDVARFFYLHKKGDAQLEFDLELALKHTEENPVFYIQYAYVRAKSLLAKAKETGITLDKNSVTGITDQELPILKKIISLQELLSTIERSHQPYLVANYVIELAGLFHSYYNQNRILATENIAKKQMMLNIVSEVANTLKICFDLLGISAPEKM